MDRQSRSRGGDDIFNEVLRAISQEVSTTISFLRKNSAPRIATRITKTGRTHRDIQRGLERELERFQSKVPAYYGVFSGRSQTESGDTSEEYKTCRGEQRTLCYGMLGVVML